MAQYTMRVIKRNEEFVYQAVINGDLEIREDGTIWRLRKRSGQKTGGAVSYPCKPVRAERPFGPYLQVRAMIDGKRLSALAHRLVYKHFKGPIPEGLTINHEDGKKRNNRPDNLEKATDSEQQIHATRVLKVSHAAHQDGPQNYMCKLTTAQVEEIKRRRLGGEKLNSIAADFDVRFQQISRIARGDRRAKA
jgi:ribosomal protein L24